MSCHIYLWVIKVKNTVKKGLIFLACAFLAAVCIINAESAADGILSSMKLCAATVIPSLFPFTVLSSYILYSGTLTSSARFFEPVCRKLFRLPGESAGIILMSFIGGFPVGAKMISSALKNGVLNENQSRRMMLFCVNAGPAFVINIVGSSMLGSKKAGAVLLASTVISSLIIGFAARFFDEEEKIQSEQSAEINRSGALIKAVESSVKTVILVCGWIIIFGALRQIISDRMDSERLKMWSNVLCEVTVGCRTASAIFPLPVTAFVLGFSGFAVHAQLLPFLDDAGLPYKLFFSFRVLNGALAAVISDILFRIFPCEVQVFASAERIMPVAFSVSAYSAAAAIITCILIILDLAPTKKM